MGLSCSCSRRQTEKTSGEVVFRIPPQKPVGPYGRIEDCPSLKEICLYNICRDAVESNVEELAARLKRLPNGIKEDLFREFVENHWLREDIMNVFYSSSLSLKSIYLDSGIRVTDEWMDYLPESLQRLYLTGCFGVTDKGLERIGNRTSLTRLSLKQCVNVTSDGLLHISRLTDLRSLDLTACKQITSRALVSIAKMTNLTKLSLQQCNQLTDEGLLNLTTLTKLRDLNLAHCFELTDVGLTILSQFSKMQRLNICSTKATRASLDIVCQMKDLEELLMAATCIDYYCGPKLKGLQKLEVVDVSFCAVGDVFLSSMASLPNLTHLNMKYTGVTDMGIARFTQKSPGVQHLNLDSCVIGDFAVEHMFRLRSLQSLNLSDTLTTSSGLSGIAECKELENLVLSRTNVSDAGLKQLRSLTKLEALFLDLRNITDDGLRHIAGLTSLKVLDLFGARISDVGLKYVSNLVNLENLEVCSGSLTDLAMDYICCLPRLKTLNLSQNHSITNGGVAKLAALPALKSLNLAHTRIDDGVTQSLRELPNLKTLGVQGCYLSRSAQLQLRSNLNVDVVGTCRDPRYPN